MATTRRDWAEPGRWFMDTLMAACRHAWQAGKPIIGTEDVFIELARRMPSLRRQLGSVLDKLDRQALAQSWDDLSPTSSADSPIANEVDAILREVTWLARRSLGIAASDAAPPWSENSRVVVKQALRDAVGIGLGVAHGMHLLVGILAVPENGAVRLLREAGLSSRKLQVEMPVTTSIRREGRPHTPSVDLLRVAGQLTRPKPGVVRLPVLVLGLTLRLRLRKPVTITALELEAVRQAVRAGRDFCTSLHVVFALCAMERQLEAVGLQLSPRRQRANSGGAVLNKWGICMDLGASIPARLPSERVTVDRRVISQSDPRWSMDAEAVCGKTPKGTTDILFEVLRTEDTAAHLYLRQNGVDVDALRVDLIRHNDEM